jgi:hypothetical protein
MSKSAQVLSIEAIKEFQEALSQLCEDAREALCTIDMEARRIVEWTAHEQLSLWKKAVRDRQEEVTQAKADLFRKQLERISGHKPDCLEEQKAVRWAQARLQEAEEKVDNCRKWSQLLPRALEEYQAPARQLAGLVEGAPPRAIIALNQIIDNLDSYVFMGSAPLVSPAKAAEASGAGPGDETGKVLPRDQPVPSGKV